MIIRKVKVTEYEYQAPINYVAGATEPDIQFQLTDYEIPSGATGRVYVGRSDGTFEYTVATISGNTVTVAPTSSMFSVKGAGAIQVTLYVGNEVVKNFAVPVYVHADLADDSAEAGSDVTGVFRAAEEQALADFQEQAEEIAEEVKESIPSDYTALTEEVDELNERINNLNPITDEIKEALLNCFEHTAYVDGDGRLYYDALRSALYTDTYPMLQVTYTPGTHKVYSDDSLDSLKPYLTVTYYESASSEGAIITNYSLLGTLRDGENCLITVSYGSTVANIVIPVVQFYNKYIWSSENGDIEITNGTMVSKAPRGFGLASQNTNNRRTVTVTHGKATYIMNVDGTDIPNTYPIPVPPTATKITVDVPDDYYCTIGTRIFDGTNYSSAAIEYVDWVLGGNTAIIEPAQNKYMGTSLRYGDGSGTIPDTPIEVTITFED